MLSTVELLRIKNNFDVVVCVYAQIYGVKYVEKRQLRLKL